MKSLVIFTLCLVTWAYAQVKGPCFEFNGKAYLEFEPDNMDISESAHYTFEFITNQTDGILLYAEGPHDFEAVFLRDGYLNYFLANPLYSGVGRSYGAHLRSSHRVNNSTYISVEIFRNRFSRRGHVLMPGDRAPIETGMVLNSILMPTPEEEHILRRGRLEGINIIAPVYIGGAGHRVSNVVGKYLGQIMDIHEKGNGLTFMDPSRNMGVIRCLDIPPVA